MALRIGDVAPNFSAETTEGKINFHDWIGNSWAILFSHPKDYTPVCTTELGYMAGLKPEFEKRNCKIIGLSADPVSDHKGWSKDIQDATGHAPTYPIIGDDRIRRGMTGRILNILGPAFVIAHRIGAQSDDLAISFLKFGFKPGHVTELRRTNRGVIFRMRKKNRPAVADPIVKVNLTFGRFSGKIRGNVPYSKSHCLSPFVRKLSIPIASANRLLRQYKVHRSCPA